MPLPTLPNPNCTNQKNDWMRSKTQQWRGRSPLSSLLCRGATRTHRQEPKLANSDRFPHLESWRWWNRWEFWHQELQRLLKSWTKRHLREPQHGGPAWWNHVHQPRSWCQVMGCWYFGAAIESKGRIWKTERHIIIDYYTYIYDPPCNLGGGCWDPWFCRGPQRQAPCVHFTKSISAVQGRELPSTRSRTFHSKNIWQGKFMFSTKSRTSHVQASKQLKKYHLLSKNLQGWFCRDLC